MAFIVYDLILLSLFLIFVSVFLYTRRSNLKKEGLLFLYRTKWGVKLINYIGNKYKKTLNFLSYISIGLGYFLMAAIIYLFYKLVKVYLFYPDIVTQIKVPPIMPLFPYVPDMFNLDFLPSFSFTYWIIIIAIIAITHEFAHGIFSVGNKVKIKSTGFGFFPFFLPIFLAAFVELDEKKMAKKPKLQQMAVLSAGVFANILTALVFFGIIWLFFSLAFIPLGVAFNTYAYSIADVPSITVIDSISLENPSYEDVTNIIGNESSHNIEAGGKKYLGVLGFWNETKIALYDDAPAIKAGLVGAITEINSVKIDSREKLAEELVKYSPGEKINIKTKTKEETLSYDILLEEHPEHENRAWLGIGFEEKKQRVIEKVSMLLPLYFIDQNTYYEPRSGVFYSSKIGEIGEFFYNLLWWLVLISVSVALINMLPVGIFDGGRFFYLSVLAITKNEKKAKKCFSLITYLFLFLLLLIMVFWAFSFFR